MGGISGGPVVWHATVQHVFFNILDFLRRKINSCQVCLVWLLLFLQTVSW